eukprot:scaffold49241_cov81-Phaeocystis_antarctica.AAC.1
MPSFRLSAGRVGVQPAAELRHLQRHGHGLHILRALLPVPCPQSAVEPSPARCVRRGRPPPPACWPPHLSLHGKSSSRLSAERAGVQPAAELRHLPRHEHGRHVQRALLTSPLLTARSPAALPPPGPNLAPPRMPSFRLSAGRVGVQPAAELRHLQRHEHATHVPRALLPVCPASSAVEPSPARCACTAVARRLPPPSRTSSRNVCPPFDSRQGASASNQPLSFDTSSVRTMYQMFRVRSSPYPADLQSSPALQPACPAVARRPPASRPEPRPAPHAFLSTLRSTRRRSTSR